MNTRTVLWVVGLVWMAVATAQLPSLAWALYAGEPWVAFAASCGAGLLLGGAIVIPMRGGERSLDHRSAFLAVTLVLRTVNRVPIVHDVGEAV